MMYIFIVDVSNPKGWKGHFRRELPRGHGEKKVSSVETKLNQGNIRSFSDLLRIKQELDSGINNGIGLEGSVHVFPSTDFEISSREDLDRLISDIDFYHSPYASMTGSIILKKKLEH
ncbi:MAG: hypothetical protein ACMUIE_03060 [Thermoplasmatota archaeon]